MYFHFSVRHTREAVLDSSLLLSVTNIGSEQAMMLQTDFVTFEPMTFADKLVSSCIMVKGCCLPIQEIS